MTFCCVRLRPWTTYWTPSARSAKIYLLCAPPGIVYNVASKFRIPNFSDQPKILKRNGHFCEVKLVLFPPDAVQKPMTPLPSSIQKQTPNEHTHSSCASLDPENLLPVDVSAKFRATLNQFVNVFNLNNEGYNGASCPFEAKVNCQELQERNINRHTCRGSNY